MEAHIRRELSPLVASSNIPDKIQIQFRDPSDLPVLLRDSIFTRHRMSTKINITFQPSIKLPTDFKNLVCQTITGEEKVFP